MDTRYSEKIFAADIEDPRCSTLKALPSRPTTPRTVMNKYRFSALIPFAFAVVSFALTLVLLLAGSKPGPLDQEFLISLNTSKVGQDIIRFERASSTSASPSSTSAAASNPLDPLNPLSTSNPLNPNNPNNPLSNLSDIFDPLVGNLTDSINNGLEDGINTVVASLVEATGIRDFYYMFLMTMCEGDTTNSSDSANEAKINRCSSYEDKGAGLNKITQNIQSSVVIGTTRISVPLIEELTSAISTITVGLSSLRKTIFAFLIISIIGSGFAFVSAIPAIIFPQSRLLLYVNLGWSSSASTFAFLAACILTGIVVSAGIVDGFAGAVIVGIRQGNMAVLFVWLGWMFIFLAGLYWLGVWFVEVRTCSFVRRGRTEEQRGNYKGIGKEILGDLKGRKDV